MDDGKLAHLLETACPRPAYLATADGGPVLALALHCVMIDEGFALAGEGSSTTSDARYVPQKDGTGVLLDQWIFTYTKPGKARKFTLHCSLQSRTKRMFIHCSEENNQNNVQVLGLQLDNYVSNPQALRNNSWGAAGGAGGGSPEPVVRNAAKMYNLMFEHILTPLLVAAEDEQGPPPATGPADEEPIGGELQPGTGGGRSNWLRSQLATHPHLPGYLAAAAVVGLAIAVGILMIKRPQRRA